MESTPAPIKRAAAFRAAGQKYQTAAYWQKTGTIPPPVNLPAVTALKLATWMGEKSIPLDLIKKVAWIIAGKTEKQLDAHIERGESLLVLDLVSHKVFLARQDAVFGCHGPYQLLILDLCEALRLVREALAAKLESN